MHTAPTCRCPRCAYPLTGLPGTPLQPFAAALAAVRCPECALEIPPGAHCLVGGATPDVVDPSGSRSVLAIALGALLLVGGPWICIIGSVALVEWLRAGGPGRAGIRLSAVQSFALGVLPVALAAAGVAWFVWRRWRRADRAAGSDERAGARLRRAMVVPGGIHLWEGEPAADARPRSLAGGDVRDVRGRRHVPLFRKAGSAEVGAIDFVTPITLWSPADSRRGANLTDGRFAGTVWLLLPQGLRADAIARDVERTLRMPTVRPAVAAPAGGAFAAVPTPFADGDPNRLDVPVAVTASTAGDPPACPRCGHGLGAPVPGNWWEPLPADFTCPECALHVPRGAIVVSGFRTALEAQARGGRRTAAVVAVIVGAALLVVAAVAALNSVSPYASIVLQVACMFALPFGIVRAIGKHGRPVPRPRTRFQRATETWIAEPGRLRIVPRGRGPAWPAETVVAARGATHLSFGEAFAADNSMPLQTDTLTVRGSAPGLGLAGERRLHVPLPAEADPDVVLERIRSLLSAPGG